MQVLSTCSSKWSQICPFEIVPAISSIPGEKTIGLHPDHLGQGRAGAKDTAGDVLKYATSLFLSGSLPPELQIAGGLLSAEHRGNIL